MATIQALILGLRDVVAKSARGSSHTPAIPTAFGNTLQESIPLYCIIDVSVLSLSAYQKIALSLLLNADFLLNAAIGKSIITIGIAEDVSFQLG